jgi:hypothetical protein
MAEIYCLFLLPAKLTLSILHKPALQLALLLWTPAPKNNQNVILELSTKMVGEVGNGGGS